MITYDFHPEVGRDSERQRIGTAGAFASPQSLSQEVRCSSLPDRSFRSIIGKNMDLQAAVSQAGYLLERSAGIWFASWALRHRAGWDYKLSGAAVATRWAMVLVSFLLAVSLPTPPTRLISLFIGLAFLCWPNFAYHLTNLFVKRPIVMIQGRVTSVAYDGSRASLNYSFTHGAERFGGTAWFERRASPADWAPGQPIDVIFDPLNPNKSNVSTL